MDWVDVLKFLEHVKQVDEEEDSVDVYKVEKEKVSAQGRVW
jgi:hypothetical protein